MLVKRFVEYSAIKWYKVVESLKRLNGSHLVPSLTSIVSASCAFMFGADGGGGGNGAYMD